MRGEWLKMVPDIPRYVEARSALLGGRAEVFGGVRGLAVLDRTAPLVAVIGDPPAAAVQEAVRLLGESGAVIGDLEHELDLPGRRKEAATLYQLEGPPRVSAFGTRLVTFADLARWDLPENLRQDFERVHGHAPIAATFVDGVPVSFCYAVETETLWDVSIDTLAEHRGRGYAGACVAWMIAHQAALGRRPVWGAMESNAASRRVAEKLGFVPADRIAVWEVST
jgi:GNAT superfamily N-acetyltransferase